MLVGTAAVIKLLMNTLMWHKIRGNVKEYRKLQILEKVVNSVLRQRIAPVGFVVIILFQILNGVFLLAFRDSSWTQKLYMVPVTMMGVLLSMVCFEGSGYIHSLSLKSVGRLKKELSSSFELGTKSKKKRNTLNK